MRYAETDKMGVVYHANYFMWFEIAAARLLRAVGRSYRDMEAQASGLPVIEAHCEYSRRRATTMRVVTHEGNNDSSPARVEFELKSAAQRRHDKRGWPHRSRGYRCDGAPVPATRLCSGDAE